MLDAVLPVMYVTAPDPATASEANVCLSRWTSSSVSSLAGPDLGMTATMAVSRSALMIGSATTTTSGSSAAPARIALSASVRSVTSCRSATTVKGPLKPAPNPSTSMSYA